MRSTLTEPKLIIADAPRAKRIAAPAAASIDRRRLPVERPIERGAAPICWRTAREGAVLPDVAPEDDATILFTSGSTGEAKGALSTHRAVTTAIYAYAIGLDRPCSACSSRRARAADQPAAHAGQRSAVPRHRRSAGDAQQLRRRPLHGADAQVGRRRGAAADREGADHLFRRRADDEPRADEPSRPRRTTISQLADRHHRRRRRRARSAMSSGCRRSFRTPSRRSATA